MIRSYLQSAWRHLTKNRLYALLNILGLSVGMACFTMIGLWVKDELSYDRFHEKADRIYRVAGIFTDESGQFDQAVTCIPLAPALVNDLPEVEAAVRIDRNDAVVQLDDKSFVEDGIQGVDASFFQVFSFKLLKGNSVTALMEPYSIVLSESMARKYFGDADPIGRSLKLFLYDPDNRGAEYKITGVVQDCPANSHFSYNFLFSFKTIESVDPNAFGHDGWFNNGYYTYLLLKPGVNAASLKDKMATFLEKYIGKEMTQYKMYWSYFLQPLPDIHLTSHLRYEFRPTSSMTYVSIFGAIGFITLLLASINYVNMSTAYSVDRLKEIGVRKMMGADKAQLVGQNLTESLLLGVVSFVVSLFWVELSRPLFESITGTAIPSLYTWNTIIPLLGTAMSVGLVAGLYPAIALAAFKPVNVLKAQTTTGSSAAWLRKSLVVIQYAATIVLIIGILVIQLQLRFIDKTDLGFNKENLLVLNVNGSFEVNRGYEGFRNELVTNANIVGVARSSAMIAGGLGNSTLTFEDASGKMVNGTTYNFSIDQDYVDTYGMKIVAGRNFIRESRTDSLGLLANESVIRNFGYTNADDAIGKTVDWGNTHMHIVGVVKDFHYNTLQQKIDPVVMYLYQRGFSRIAVRISGNVNEGVDLITRTWKEHFPNSVLDFSFAEDRLANQYRSEQRFSRVFVVFSGISLGIACLGLFALVSHAAQRRTKEIGIRKVLGASTLSILNMLSKEFLVLIVVASLIAVPIGYYLMQDWLLNFAYRIELNPGVFVIAGLIVTAIAWLTISLRSVRAAGANPVNSLRSE